MWYLFWNIPTPLGDGWVVALFQEVLGRVNIDGRQDVGLQEKNKKVEYQLNLNANAY